MREDASVGKNAAAADSTEEASRKAEVASYLESVADKLAWLLLDPECLVRKQHHIRFSSHLKAEKKDLDEVAVGCEEKKRIEQVLLSSCV